MHKKPTNRTPRIFRITLVSAVIALVIAALFGSASAQSSAGAKPTAQLVASTTPIRAAALPPGQYANGHYVMCVNTFGTRLVKAHTGAESSACPARTRKATIAVKGPAGPKGATGARGPAGPAGADAPAVPTGVGTVSVARGAGGAAVWAKVSTPISMAEGGTASNTFRMTCSTANAPCTITAQARATVAGSKVYPRLLINRSDLDTGKPSGLCEYADGTDNDGGTRTLTTVAAELPLGIGGSLDCGTDQTRPASGVVDSIKVGPGYYDIAATFSFTS